MSSLVTIVFLSLVILGGCSRHTMSKEELGLRTEKLSHFHFYVHDIFGRPNSTDVNVAKPLDDNTTTATTTGLFFGRVDVLDIPLRVSPDIMSKQIGHMQGIVVCVSTVDVLNFFMTVNFVFTQGKYNGSTLIMLGKNQASLKEREMPILGGSGVFRFARGYALSSTYSQFDPKSGLAIYEYHVYALH